MRGRRSGWRRRIVVVGLTAVVAYVALVATGFSVQTVLFAALVVVIAGVVFSVYDLADIVQPAAWYVGYSGHHRQQGADRRAARLRRWLEVSVSGPTTTPLVRDALVAVVADIVQHDHAIDLDGDPDAARSILGPELSAYVLDPPATTRRLQPRELAEIVSRIEALSPDAPLLAVPPIPTGKA